MPKYTIGVDLGGTNIDVGVVAEDWSIISQAHTPTLARRAPEEVLDDIARCVREAVAAAGLAPGDIGALGIGSPGTCDAEKGEVLNAHNLGWFGVPVRGELEKRVGVPVSLGNDADCAALGETVAGAARGCSDVLMVTLGTGIGGGIVAGGRVYAGHRSLGGEVGHMCIAMDGESCTCGQRGCWEAYASATALIRRGEAAAAAQPDSALAAMRPLDGLKIFTAANEGDAAAKAVVDEYIRCLGVGLVNMINVLYPEMVLLGGGISRQGEKLLAPLREYVAGHFFVGLRKVMPRIGLASLGPAAGIIGAAALCG